MIKLRKTEKWLLGIALCTVILYSFLASSCYTLTRIRAVKRAYKEVIQMSLLNLDDEDEDILLGDQSKRIDVIIADENLVPVYSNRNRDGVEQVDKYIVGKLDQFYEEPKPVVRDYGGMTVVRLKALVEQNGKKFYVVIRTEIRGVREMVVYTTWFMAAVILMACAGYYMLKKKIDENERGRDEEIELRARELMEAQKEFVANISHELKTPLAVISGQVEMLECMGEEIDREYYYNSIHEEICKMSDMVGTLLDLTILDHRMKEMEMCEVNLSDLMEYMVLKYDAIFKKNKIKLQTQIAQGCMVRGNRMYLEEAVNNYIMNAVQYTPQGKRIGIFLDQNKGEARVRIFNECSWIAEEKMEAIWSSFYMDPDGKYRTNAKTGNAGLGLYLVKKIADQHGGSCGVQNKENGVEFWLRIPELSGK